MKAYFVSDLHLTSPEDPRSRVFLLWLECIAKERPTHLFLVGDIFDLWIGSHEFFKKTWAPVVTSLKNLVAAGVEVHFFEGNHDLHLETFWSGEVGARVHTDAAEFELAGQRVRVEHGDLINPDDKGYLFLRWLLRTAVMRGIALNLPDWVVARIGERASRMSRAYTSTAKELPADGIRTLIHGHAERVHATRPFDLLITGHVHVRDDWRLASGARSVNLGSWFDKPGAFALDKEKAEFIELGL